MSKVKSQPQGIWKHFVKLTFWNDSNPRTLNLQHIECSSIISLDTFETSITGRFIYQTKHLTTNFGTSRYKTCLTKLHFKSQYYMSVNKPLLPYLSKKKHFPKKFNHRFKTIFEVKAEILKLIFIVFLHFVYVFFKALPPKQNVLVN